MNLYLRMAGKSLITRRRQYRSLFSVCFVGVCIMLFVMCITDGMLASVNDKARLYYGGDFQFLGGVSLEKTEIVADEDMAILESVLPSNAVTSKRYDYDAHNISFYFEGANVRQRVMKGVDFNKERLLFEKFTYVEGSAESLESHDSIIVSSLIAQKLGVHAGDSITVFLPTKNGYNNTIQVVVTGIFQDSSVFGMYTSYIDYDALMKVLDSESIINRICVYFPSGEPSKSTINKIYDSLSKKVSLYPIIQNKNDFYNQYSGEKDSVYAIVPLDANILDLRLMVQALHLIVLVIVVLLVVIISIGISSTFRVIVMKRSVESGTFRALGMKPSMLLIMYLTEVLLLLLAGCLLGFVLSLGLLKIASLYNLSFISGFDMFLTNGYLSPVLHITKASALVGVILVTTITSVLFTLRKLIHISPVGAIASIQ